MGSRGGVTTLAQTLSPCPRWCSQTDGPGTSPLYGRSLLPCVSASSHNTSWPVSLRNNERRHVMQPQHNNAPFDAQYLLVLSGLKYQKLLQQVCLKYHYEVKTAQCFTRVNVHVMDNKKRAVKLEDQHLLEQRCTIQQSVISLLVNNTEYFIFIDNFYSFAMIYTDSLQDTTPNQIDLQSIKGDVRSTSKNLALL